MNPGGHCREVFRLLNPSRSTDQMGGSTDHADREVAVLRGREVPGRAGETLIFDRLDIAESAEVWLVAGEIKPEKGQRLKFPDGRVMDITALSRRGGGYFQLGCTQKVS